MRRDEIDAIDRATAAMYEQVRASPRHGPLIRRIESNPTKQRIVRSIHGLCTGMGIEVISEGIETPAERDCVADIGIDLLQGFLFSPPELEFVRPEESTFGPDEHS